jgi:hypothetical protein
VIPKTIWTATALAAAVLSAGCKSDQEYAQASQPKPVIFDGKVDPKFVGVWKSTNGLSTMDLQKDGSVKIETISNSRNGPNDNKVSGEWRASGSNLLFHYDSKQSGSVILKYSAVLAGKTLTMQQTGMKLKMVYKRK